MRCRIIEYFSPSGRKPQASQFRVGLHKELTLPRAKYCFEPLPPRSTALIDVCAARSRSCCSVSMFISDMKGRSCDATISVRPTRSCAERVFDSAILAQPSFSTARQSQPNLLVGPCAKPRNPQQIRIARRRSRRGIVMRFTKIIGSGVFVSLWEFVSLLERASLSPYPQRIRDAINGIEPGRDHRNLQNPAIVKSRSPQAFNISLPNLGRILAQLDHVIQHYSLLRRDGCARIVFFQCLDQLCIQRDSTQELCVRLVSILTALGHP